MTVLTVGHHPELTAEEAMRAFQRHFAGQYEVYKVWWENRDFAVKKSAWLGISVKLKQETGKTSFVFTYFPPSLSLNLLVGLSAGVLGTLLRMLFLHSRFKAVENEVKAFIESGEEFK